MASPKACRRNRWQHSRVPEPLIVPNSVAIVTGASSGIGKAAALRLAEDFAAIVLVARRGEQLAEVGRAVEAAGARPLPLELDLMRPEAAETVVRATRDAFGRIDALVNVAGAVPGIDLFEMTDAQWDSGMALKFHGARRLAICAWDLLKSSKGAIFATNNRLPLPLQRFRPGILAGDASDTAPRIMFPPNGARLELGLGGTEMALKISGGVKPLTLLVNGVPRPAETSRRTLFFTPDGPGFARLTVMDARGVAYSVVVRIE